MEPLFLNEVQLANRWGMSNKTLQRWRSDGRGPRYVKLSRRVAYPIEEVLDFESKSTYNSTSERSLNVLSPYGEELLNARQIAQATNLPYYIFCNTQIRKMMKVPHSKLNTGVRFNLTDVQRWAIEWHKRHLTVAPSPDAINSDIGQYVTLTLGGKHD